MEVGQCLVDGRKILLYYGFAPLPVSFLDGVLDGSDSFRRRQHATNRKEASLHDGVDSAAHARLARDSVSVDHIKLELLLEDGLLHLPREMVPNFVRPKRGIQQECSSIFGCREHVHAIHELKLVTSDKAGLGDQISGFDGIRPEAKMRNGDGASLF